MNNTALKHCGKLEVKSSKIEGYGVFATEDILKDTILEEVPFVLFPRYTSIGKAVYDMLRESDWVSEREKLVDNLRLNLKFKDPEKYYFKWFPAYQPDGKPVVYTVLPLGNGCIYNTSNTDNNAGWYIKESLFIFKAEKDIKAGEEIRTFYGYFVGENGSVFSCDSVFNLAISSKDKKIKSFRFGGIDSFEACKTNGYYSTAQKILVESKDGLIIKKISSTNIAQEDQQTIDIPIDIPISILYSKIAECKAFPRAFTRIHVEYGEGENVTKAVLIFKNR